MGETLALNIPAKASGAMKPGLTPSEEVVIKPNTNNGVSVSTNASLEPAAVVPPAAKADETLILGKFKTQADLEIAYKALEAKQGTTPPANEPVVPPALTIENAVKTLTDKGLDYMKYANEYSQNGSLSSASYQEIFGKGITAQQIDSFISTQAPVIAAQKAKLETDTAEIITHAGGKDEFVKLITYVKDAGSPDEIASYNRAIDNGDKVAAKLLLSNFKTQYQAALGKEPNLNGGAPPTGATGDVYTTLDQYHEDLGSAKYKSSPAFRQAVDAKIERSTSLYARKR